MLLTGSGAPADIVMRTPVSARRRPGFVALLERAPDPETVAQAAALPNRVFRDRYARGGYAWTWAINQTIGALLARFAIRAGLRPVHLSMFNIATGIAGSGWVLLLHRSMPFAAAAVGLLAWELAYSLDCADGQVARATGRSSPQGAVVDLLSDFLVQLTVILAMLQVATPAVETRWLSSFSALVAGGWLISIFYTGILGSSTVPKTGRTSSLRRIVTHGRDYGLHVALLPLAMLTGAPAVAVIMSVIAGLNFIALFLGIGSHGRDNA
jgi:phosphatidylglycerophosphate synthase